MNVDVISDSIRVLFYKSQRNTSSLGRKNKSTSKVYGEGELFLTAVTSATLGPAHD